MRSLLFGLAFSLSLVGCGYSFQGSSTVLPPDVKNVYIPLVSNSSAESGLAPVVTEALRDQFERFGAVQVVENIQDADAVLNAKIVSVRRQTSTVTSKTDTALEFDTVLKMAADLRRVGGGLLWQDKDVSVSRSFGATSGIVVTSSADFASSSLGAADLANLDSREISRGQEREALTYLAEEAARQIYNKAVAADF